MLDLPRACHPGILILSLFASACSESAQAPPAPEDSGESDAPPRESDPGLTSMEIARRGIPEEVRPLQISGFSDGWVVEQNFVFCGQPSEAAIRQLAVMGTNTFLSTRPEGEPDWDERAVAAEVEATFLRLPIQKPLIEITDELMAAFDEVMESCALPMVLHDETNQPVLALWTAWLVEHRSMERDAALAIATSVGLDETLRPVVEKRLAGGP